MRRIVIDSWDSRLGLAFFMLGVRGRVTARPDGRDQVSATHRLVTVQHQYGGYACAHEDVTGVIFRLHEAPALQDPARLFGGLAAISEYGAQVDGAVDRRLEAFGYTFGEPLRAQAVSDVFRDYLPIPPFSRAWEAFAETVPVDPRVVEGWTPWAPGGACVVDAELLDQLVAATALSQKPLGLYLLWSNSD
jgi:hypothetical protein